MEDLEHEDEVLQSKRQQMEETNKRIKEFQDNLNKELAVLKADANPSCSKCHGFGCRGVANFVQPIICNCVFKTRRDREKIKKVN